MPSTLSLKFFDFIACRYAPFTAPLNSSNVILRIECNFIINCTVATICTILGHGIVTTIAPFIGFPRIILFFLGFTPSIITAILPRSTSANVEACPFYTAWKAKVYSLIRIDKCYTVNFCNLDTFNSVITMEYIHIFTCCILLRCGEHAQHKA